MAELVEIARTLRKRLDGDQIRCLIQELDNCSENDPKTPGRVGTSFEPKRLARVDECTCSCVCSPMNPTLWSALPIELLQLVFARLPLPQILQIKSLSKSWNRSFTSEDPEFLQACTDAGPRVFAMITEGCDYGLISVRLYDTKSNTWYSYSEPMSDEHLVTMSAGDGGLVCIVSISAVNKKQNPLTIVVFNPLTRHWRLLSPHALCNVQPRMVQLVMDQDTKCYKVIVVGEKRHREGHATRMVAEIFCSETGVWSSAKAFPDLIFGYQYRWDLVPLYVDDDPEESGHFLEDIARPGPCAYDCAGRRLVEFDVESNPCRGAAVESYALVKDHLFVLHRKLFKSTERDGFVLRHHRYVVSEYRYQGEGRNCDAKWVKLRVHKCEGFEYPPSSVRYSLVLHACKGFLLLKAANDENYVFEHELTWLYDLSTTKWQKVPNVPFPSELDSEAMFELRWDAVP